MASGACRVCRARRPGLPASFRPPKGRPYGPGDARDGLLSALPSAMLPAGACPGPFLHTPKVACSRGFQGPGPGKHPGVGLGPADSVAPSSPYPSDQAPGLVMGRPAHRRPPALAVGSMTCLRLCYDPEEGLRSPCADQRVGVVSIG